MLFEPGDYVLHPKYKGVRGQVLWTEGRIAFVCWETGYEPYEEISMRELEPTNLLDMLVEGRELKYEHIDVKGRCKCGTNLDASRRRWRGQRLMICCKCRLYYNPDGTPHVHGSR